MNSDPWADSSAMDHHKGPGSIIEEQRALQLALELSMLRLTTAESSTNHINSSLMTSAPMGTPLTPTFSFLNNTVDISHVDDTFRSDFGVFPQKKSQNTTECVPVPSSEHVAEIVGRQGCKIKALRAKTNTYIKTPVRGEEPVFVVTGRREDVALAKRDILSAADHFTQIRASRKGGAISPTPAQITIQVRVAYKVVGLVVGPKGATIKRIQQQTHTYIVTPSRDDDPVFEVTGSPESVQMAKREIEAHVAARTGSSPLDSDATHLLAGLYENGPYGLGLGAMDSLSSSLSSVSVDAGERGGDSGGWSSSSGGSLSSLNGNGGARNIGSKDTPQGNNMFSSFFDYPSLWKVSALKLSHDMNGGGGVTVGSSSSGGGSLSSLSSLNAFNA